MKVCKFCGQPNDDNSKTCDSCGGAQFNYQCANCGTLFDSGNYCPKCGIKIGTQPKRCPSCGNDYYTNACPNCGFNNNGTRREIVFADNSVQPKKKRKTWLWVLGWLFIFPLPLTILLLRKKDMKPWLKYGIIALAWIVYLIIGLAGAGSNESGNTSNDPNTNIRNISFSTTVKEEITLKVGDKYSSGYLKVNVRRSSDFSQDDVVFVSDNPEIATIALTRVSLSTYLYYEIKAISPGETNVYARSKDGTVSSPKIKIVVTGANGSIPSPSETQDPESSGDNGSSIEKTIDDFVNHFNSKSSVKLTYTESFSPQEKSSIHYRTEFRLTAYNDSIGKSYKYNDVTIDLVARKPSLNSGNPVIRLYANGGTLEELIAIVEASANFFDPDMTSETIKEITDYLDEHKSANGYYKGNIGLLLLGDELMIKYKND